MLPMLTTSLVIDLILKEGSPRRASRGVLGRIAAVAAAGDSC